MKHHNMMCVCVCFYIIHTFQSASIFTDYDADEYPSVKTSVHCEQGGYRSVREENLRRIMPDNQLLSQ